MSVPPNDHQQLDMFETLLDAAVDAIIIIDSKGEILRFNRAAQKMFVYSAEEAKGQNVSILMPESHRGLHDRYLHKYRKTGQAGIIGKGREEWGRRSNGEIFPMRLSVGESLRGSTVHYVGIIHDLSQQRDTENKLHALEQQLFHAERLVTLGELTAGIAHEINQPLTAIAAYADAGARLQPDRVPGSLDHVAICQRIADQARRAGQVVDRLRGLVQGTQVSKAQLQVGPMIRNVLTVFDHELKHSGITLQLQVPEDTPTVFVDEIHIQQIVVNLVKNSIDSIRERSGVDGILGNGHILIAVNHDNEAVCIHIIDDGPGVDTKFREKLFEPFFTSKPRGFGLGLSICRNIAALHGGSLHHTQPDSGGAQFTLTLPLATIG